MYAVVKVKRDVGAEILNVDVPRIGRDEVLVEVKMASICGTDVHIWDWNEWAQRNIKKVPIIFGHEFAGVVVEVGRDVRSVQVGDMVSAEGHIVDGTCYQCRTGRMHVCRNVKGLGIDRDGVFAEYVALPERNIWINDPDLDPAIASLQDPLGNAVHAILPDGKQHDIIGRDVAVFGCGPIGLMAIAVLKTIGASRVFAVAGGRNRKRMELAKRMGADIVLNAKREGGDIVRIIHDLTDGRGVDVALELSGSPYALKQSLETVTPGGRVSMLGLQDRPVEVDFNATIISKGVTVYGVTGRRIFQTWYQMKGLLSDQKFRDKIATVITHRIPIREIER